MGCRPAHSTHPPLRLVVRQHLVAGAWWSETGGLMQCQGTQLRVHGIRFQAICDLDALVQCDQHQRECNRGEEANRRQRCKPEDPGDRWRVDENPETDEIEDEESTIDRVCGQVVEEHAVRPERKQSEKLTHVDGHIGHGLTDLRAVCGAVPALRQAGAVHRSLLATLPAPPLDAFAVHARLEQGQLAVRPRARLALENGAGVACPRVQGRHELKGHHGAAPLVDLLRARERVAAPDLAAAVEGRQVVNEAPLGVQEACIFARHQPLLDAGDPGTSNQGVRSDESGAAPDAESQARDHNARKTDDERHPAVEPHDPGHEDVTLCLARGHIHQIGLGLFECQREWRQDVCHQQVQQQLQPADGHRYAQHNRSHQAHALSSFDAQVEGDVLLSVVVDPAPLPHGSDNGAEVVVHEHQVGRVLGHRRARDAHGHARVRALQRGRVVHAVAGHRHDVALANERLDQCDLVGGLRPGPNGYLRRHHCQLLCGFVHGLIRVLVVILARRRRRDELGVRLLPAHLLLSGVLQLLYQESTAGRQLSHRPPRNCNLQPTHLHVLAPRGARLRILARSNDADLLPDGHGCWALVAGDHDHTDACTVALLDASRHRGAGRVVDAPQAEKAQPRQRQQHLQAFVGGGRLAQRLQLRGAERADGHEQTPERLASKTVVVSLQRLALGLGHLAAWRQKFPLLKHKHEVQAGHQLIRRALQDGAMSRLRREFDAGEGLVG
mmetsp:Transcript_92509/g.299057  ORF Transcript_92509/g.299057 Transcript_92509/m.299057 type:complete len:725 (+) Transcript_92509:50-2224(+)